MEEPTKEQLAEIERKKNDPQGPNPELACWIFEALAKEDVPVIQQLMYHPTILSVLRRYVESMPESKITWVVTMLTTMLQEVARAPLDGANVRQLRLLMSTLLSRASKQFQLEQSRPDSDRSQLLQCLVQAAVVVDTTVRSVLNTIDLNGTSPQARAGVADLESKEETDLSESKQLDADMPGFRWTPDACGRGIETLNARKGVRKAPRAGADSYSTALSNIGFTSGKHRFNIVLNKLTGPGPLIGFGNPAINLNADLGSEPGSASWGNQALLINGVSHPFGPKFNPGDVITVELDIDNEALFFYRNSVLVGQALGREGTGAVAYLPFGEGPFHPAVSLLTPGDEVEIQEVTDGAVATDTEMPSWFAPVREAVELLRSCARRELPASIITREFIPACQQKASRVIESIHPYDGTGCSESVEISGASQLEIHFDPQTDMGPKDTISIEGNDDGQHAAEHAHVNPGSHSNAVCAAVVLLCHIRTKANPFRSSSDRRAALPRQLVPALRSASVTVSFAARPGLGASKTVALAVSATSRTSAPGRASRTPACSCSGATPTSPVCTAGTLTAASI
jgi:hypothetical protein